MQMNSNSFSTRKLTWNPTQPYRSETVVIRGPFRVWGCACMSESLQAISKQNSRVCPQVNLRRLRHPKHLVVRPKPKLPYTVIKPRITLIPSCRIHCHCKSLSSDGHAVVETRLHRAVNLLLRDFVRVA